MIVTVTMNPALDKTAHVRQLLPGGLNRLENLRVDAGGKGINVSKMVAVLGGQTVCTGFIGGGTGMQLCRLLNNVRLAHDFIEVDGATRTNLKVIDAQASLTELSEPGIAVTQRELDCLLDKILEISSPPGPVVLGGSLPQKADAGIYGRFIGRLRAAGLKTILDADGEAFRQGLEAVPCLIKPNRFELLQYYNLPQDTPESRLPELCRPLLNAGVEWVVLSMGADGAMFFTPGRSARARPLPVTVRSAVGAGDSMVGALAYALEQNMGFEQTVRLAMACSAGAVATEGTNPPTAEQVALLAPQLVMEDL